MSSKLLELIALSCINWKAHENYRRYIDRTFMKDKVCLITGATSGIGKAAALQLAHLGATVVMVGRNPQRTATAVQEIRQQSGNNQVESMLADLSSQSEIRKLASEFHSSYQRLDVLVNNAGALMLSRRLSTDGIEMTFALNHLNYFLLTHLLLDTLKSSGPSRIVNVSSDSHQDAFLDFEDLQLEQSYGGYKAYGRSKLANLLFTYELSRRLQGSNVTANALHPGLVATKFLANNGLRGRVFNLFVRIVGRSATRGARPITYLASSAEVEGVSGKYFVEEGLVESSEASNDKDAALKLWHLSEEYTGLPPSTPDYLNLATDEQEEDDSQNASPEPEEASEPTGSSNESDQPA